MSNYPAKVYGQAFIILASSSTAPAVSAPPVLYQDSLGIYSTRLHASVTGPVDTTPRTENVTLKTTFSSVPVIWDAELKQEYRELGQALNEMTELEEGTDWKVDEPVYNVACFVAAGLMASSFPAPRIFNHGPKSVVFNWSHAADNLYLTISADHISALVSTPERIKRRVEYSVNALMNPSLALSSLRAALSEQPVKQLITGTVSEPEVVD